jgi:DNA-nicking Smr family endonuclease
MSYYAHASVIEKYNRRAEPDIIVDLHGYTTAECAEVLENLFHDRSIAHARIIVGKGKNSENGAVLPTFVKNILDREHVSYIQSHARSGGAGALEVYL